MIGSTLFTAFKKGRIITRETTEDYRYAWGIWDNDLTLLYDYGFCSTEKDAQARGRAAMRRLRVERDLQLHRASDTKLTDLEAYGDVELYGAKVFSENAFWGAMQDRTHEELVNEIAIPHMWTPQDRSYTYFRLSGIKYDVVPDTQKYAYAIYSSARETAVEWGAATDVPRANEAAEKALRHWIYKRGRLNRERLANKDVSPDGYGEFTIEIAEFLPEAAFRTFAKEHTREQVKDLLNVTEEMTWTNKPEAEAATP